MKKLFIFFTIIFALSTISCNVQKQTTKTNYSTHNSLVTYDDEDFYYSDYSFIINPYWNYRPFYHNNLYFDDWYYGYRYNDWYYGYGYSNWNYGINWNYNYYGYNNWNYRYNNNWDYNWNYNPSNTHNNPSVTPHPKRDVNRDKDRRNTYGPSENKHRTNSTSNQSVRKNYEDDIYYSDPNRVRTRNRNVEKSGNSVIRNNQDTPSLSRSYVRPNNSNATRSYSEPRQNVTRSSSEPIQNVTRSSSESRQNVTRSSNQNVTRSYSEPRSSSNSNSVRQSSSSSTTRQNYSEPRQSSNYTPSQSRSSSPSQNYSTPSYSGGNSNSGGSSGSNSNSGGSSGGNSGGSGSRR